MLHNTPAVECLSYERGDNSWQTWSMHMKNMLCTSAQLRKCMCEVSSWSNKKWGSSSFHKLLWLCKNSSHKRKVQGEITLDKFDAYTWKICQTYLRMNMNAYEEFQDDQLWNVEEVHSTRFLCYITILQWNAQVIIGEITLEILKVYTWKICHAHLHNNMNIYVKFQVKWIRNEGEVCSTKDQ